MRELLQVERQRRVGHVEMLRDGSRGHALRTALDQQPEHVEPRFLGKSCKRVKHSR